MKNVFSARKLALLASFTALSMIMFMIESLFPPLFIPGAKMGLSNIFSLYTLIVLGPVEAFVVVVVRTLLGSLFVGNLSTLMYSMTAGIVSIIVSSILMKLVYPKISLIAISVVSAVVHNLTQNVVFCYVSNTPQMFSYMPWLAVIGVVAGIIVGYAVYFIVKLVPKKVYFFLDDDNPKLAAETGVSCSTGVESGDSLADAGSDENTQCDKKSNGARNK